MLKEDIDKNLQVAKPEILKEWKANIAMKIADALMNMNEDEQEKRCPLYKKVDTEIKRRKI